MYAQLSQQTKNTIDNAFGRKYRYFFTDDDELKLFQYEDAYKVIRVKEELLHSIYSFFSLHEHPSFLSICQFRDAFKNEFRADWMMAEHATQCAISFMSIFIVDFMNVNSGGKAKYDQMKEPIRFAIGMYEDAMRGEGKFN